MVSRNGPGDDLGSLVAVLGAFAVVIYILVRLLLAVPWPWVDQDQRSDVTGPSSEIASDE